jgi:hypothetical protein
MMERDNVTEEALLLIITIARRHLGGNSAQQRQDTAQLVPDSFLY